MNNKIKNCKLGLDIGVSSVGYAVLNVDNDVMEAGVRLFSERSAKENEKRRDHRHSRRLHRRRVHRLTRIDRLFHRSGLCDKDFHYNCEKGETPYSYRCKGLKERLTQEQLAIALRHIAKHRGLQNFSTDVSEKERSKKSNEELDRSTKIALESKQEKLNSGLYPCEIQLDELLTNGSVRGNENVFFTKDFSREARAILNKQREFYSDIITNDFIKEFIFLIETRREYFEGPGTNGDTDCKYGEGSKSPYGWSSTEEWMLSLRGECTYCEGETRIAKCSPTLELFNVLNDLNNTTFNGEHLTREQKKLLIEKVFKKKASAPKYTEILKVLNYDESTSIMGCRINSDGEPLFTPMAGYCKIASCSKSSDKSIDLNDFNLLDKIADIMGIYQTKEEISKHLQEDAGCTKDFSDKISSISQNIFKGTASLSKKAISLVLDDMYNTSLNSSALFHKRNISALANIKAFTDGMLKSDIFEKAYVSPVVKKAVRETIIVFNILSGKYDFDSVTVELAREKNTDDERKYLKKINDKNEKINKRVAEVIGDKKVSANTKTKVKLWIEQDGRDIYDGKSIGIDDLINNPNAYEIDHIIPVSVSFKDSFDNKVLTSHKNNQNKGQRTPYQWMSKEDFAEFKARVLDLQIKNKEFASNSKRNNLLFTGDITKWDVQKEFINRNLVDTRYATKEILSLFKAYFKYTGARTKVYNVNGSFTSYLRYKWGLKKDRDLDQSHHAVDAMIIAIAPSVLNCFDVLEKCSLDDDSIYVNKFTGEVMEDKSFYSVVGSFTPITKNFLMKKVDYTYEVEKKDNQQLTNETLYSTRIFTNDKNERVEYKVSKIKDIYTEPVSKLKKFFNADDCQKLLVYKNDIETFNILQKIFNEYYIDEKINPFNEYRKINGYVKKYSKKGNGPAVKSLKYLNGTINEPLDISHKMNGVRKNKRVVQTGCKTHHIEVYSNGITQRIVVIRQLNYTNGVINNKVKNNLLANAKIDADYVLIKRLYPGTTFSCNGNKYSFRGFDSNSTITCTKLGENSITRLTIGAKNQIF